jgi:signal peptidase II
MTLLKFEPGVVRRLALGLPIALLAVFLDQLSKWYVLTQVPEAREGRVPELPFLDFVTTWNHGVSFSMGNHLAHDRLIFGALALLVSAALVLWMAKGAKPLILVGLGLVTGGALGNSIDRVRFGAVEDFLYFHVGAFDWWPVFNVADSAICVGAALMVFDSLFDRPLSHKNTP